MCAVTVVVTNFHNVWLRGHWEPDAGHGGDRRGLAGDGAHDTPAAMGPAEVSIAVARPFESVIPSTARCWNTCTPRRMAPSANAQTTRSCRAVAPRGWYEAPDDREPASSGQSSCGQSSWIRLRLRRRSSRRRKRCSAPRELAPHERGLGVSEPQQAFVPCITPAPSPPRDLRRARELRGRTPRLPQTVVRSDHGRVPSGVPPPM